MSRVKIDELTTELPTKPGKYLIRKPYQKYMFPVEIKMVDGELFISGEPAYVFFREMVIFIKDYPLKDCAEGTEWMTEEEAQKYSWYKKEC